VPPDYIPSKTFADGRSVPAPGPATDATWNPPYTRNHNRLKPTLNDEPVPGAIAACEGPTGWVRYVGRDGEIRERGGVVRVIPGDRA
jgi:hypothetical protein